MNASNSTEHTVKQYIEPDALKVFRLSLTALVMLASLLGNAIVLKAVFDSTKRKTVTHYLVANLAFGELIGTVFHVFLQVYNELKHFPFGDVMCRVLNPCQALTLLAITYTLSAIALHRYRVFSRERPRSRKMSGFRTAMAIILLWLIGLAVVFPSFLYQQLVQIPENETHFWCIHLFPGETIETFPSPALKRYYLVKFVLNYFLPMLLMSASYGFVGVKLRHHRNRSIRAEAEESSDNRGETTQQENLSTQQQGNHIENRENAVRMEPIKEEPNESGAPRPTANVTSPRTRKRYRQARGFTDLERSILKMFYAIIIVFVAFYFPYQVFFILEYFSVIHWTTWSYFDMTRDYIYLMTLFPSALHPICYGTMSKFFARTFSRLILCRRS